MLPVILTLGSIKIYSYPLFLGFAWGVAYHLARYFSVTGFQNDKGFNLFFWGNFIASWAGAKIVFLIVSDVSNYKQYLVSSSFWLGGGFVFYGGLIFSLFYSLFLCLVIKKYDLDRAVSALLALPFAHAIGRCGCFLAGCCYGVETDGFISVYMHNNYRHPVQLYEALLLLGLGVLLVYLFKRKKDSVTLIITYLGIYSIIRFFMEFLRGDEVRGLWAYGISTSQLFSIFLVTVLLIYGLGRMLSKKKGANHG